jgi:hypothetical protein
MKNVINRESATIETQLKDQIIIGVADTVEERQNIYRFRYNVYVEEMGKQLQTVDHENKTIKDELDDQSILLYACVNEKVVGTIRLTVGIIEEFPPDLVEVFSMEKFRSFYIDREDKRLAFSSKVMVALEYRGSAATYLLTARLYEIAREQGLQFTFCGGAPHMIPLYEQIGFQRFLPNFVVPEYGYMIPFVFVLEDIDHLRAIRSPSTRIARKFTNSLEASKWFKENFPDAKDFLNSRLINDEGLWEIFQSRLGQYPEKAVSMLRRLNTEEVKTFLTSGIIVKCKRGDHFVASGTVANEQYILLSGMMKVLNPSLGVDQALLEAGQSFGEIGLITPQKQIVDVIAITDAEVLVIPRQAFEKLRRTNPQITEKIIQGIFDAPGRFYYYWPKLNNNQRLA